MTIKNIPVGYKDSPLGIIPQDWEVKRFRDIGNFLRNNTLSRDKMSESEGCIQNIHYGDILIKYKEILKVSKTNIPWIVEDRKYSPLGDMLQNGDIVISDTAEDYTVGKATELMEINGAFVVAGLHTMPFRPLSDLFSPRFLGYYLNSMAYRFQLYALVQGIKVCSISKKAMSGTFLIVPPLAEQEKIAEILSTWDKAIEKQTQLIQKLELRKKGLMQQLITGKKRLPGFTGEWEKVKFGDCVEIYRGGSPRPIERFITNQPDGINWIKIGDVKPNEKYINRTEERIDPEGVSRSRQVYVGDFILSNSMSFGRPYILNIDGCIHDGWLVIQNYHTYFDKDFLYYMLCSENVMAQYVGMAAGSSVKNLNKEKVASLLLYIPKTIEEQQAIAKLLDVIDHQIEFAIRRRKKFYIQKNGLMQQLLTSKKRVRI